MDKAGGRRVGTGSCYGLAALAIVGVGIRQGECIAAAGRLCHESNAVQRTLTTCRATEAQSSLEPGKAIAANWQRLPVGAGGFVTGIDVAPDGTMVARTDSYGAYIWKGTAWQQLVTATSMPAAFVRPNFDDQGVYEVRVAASNPNILYMSFKGHVFKSTDKGGTWTQTSFTPVTLTMDNYRIMGQKMAIDPENPNVVYVGTPRDGLFTTMDGGATWHGVSAVPASGADRSGNFPGISGIVFDAQGVARGATQTIFASSFDHGVYESRDAGVSWAAIGGPARVQYAAVSITGVYYATDGITLWRYQNGTWARLFSNAKWGVETVVVNPGNPNEIAVQSESGQLSVSYDGGATWSGYNANYSLSSSDIPWLGTTGSWMSTGGTVFNPLNPNQLITSAGVGVWTVVIPTSGFTSRTPVLWKSQSIGIEQLVANAVVVPTGGNPILASWDRPFFYIKNTNVYPSTYMPNTGNSLTEGWSIDYASSDPSFVVGLADNWGLEQSGYSTDGGQTWATFASWPSGAGSRFIGGTIASSSPTDIIWAPAGGVAPYYTLNGGRTWNSITLPGISSWADFDFASYLDTRTVAADRVLPDTFYLYYPGKGVYKSTDGGVSWTQVYRGQLSAYSNYNAELQSVPGQAGNLFFTGGRQAGGPSEPFMTSKDGGATWTAIAKVSNINSFGFGAPAPGKTYPSIYVVGWVDDVYGIWQSTDNAQSWTVIGTYPTGSLDEIKTIAGNPNVYGEVYVGFAGSGYAYLTTP